MHLLLSKSVDKSLPAKVDKSVRAPKVVKSAPAKVVPKGDQFLGIDKEINSGLP